MKLAKINQFLVFTALLAGAGQVLPITPVNQAEITEIDQLLGGLDLSTITVPYENAIEQAANALSAGNFNGVVTELKAAAVADPVQTLAALQNGGQFSAKNLSVFSSAQLEQLANSVLTADMGDVLDNPGAIADYAKLYATTGLNDDNFENAVGLLHKGIDDADTGEISSALNIIASEGNDDDFLKMITTEITTMGSVLNVKLSATFSQAQLESTFRPFIPDKPIFNKSARLGALGEKLAADLNNKNVTDVINTLSELKSIKPVTSRMFENGNALNYQALKAAGFTDAQIGQFAQAAGLAPADITDYLAGKYTGASDGPPVVPGGDPVNPINTGTGNQNGNIPGAQEYYKETEATANSLKSLIASEAWTQSDFETLISMQEASLAKLKASGTATEEEITEIQNEINISRQILADPETKFAPETVDPVVL